MCNKLELFFILILVTQSTIILGQSTEIFGGINLNKLHEFHKDDHFETNYSIRNGYRIGIGVDSIKIDWLTMRFTLAFDSYGGEIHETYQGLASGSSSNVQFEKSVISIGLYPINFHILKNADVNLGIEISRLVNEKFSGTKWGILLTDSGYVQSSSDIHDKIDRFSSTWYCGFQARIAYNINLTESLALKPQYSFYFGFSDEFAEIIDNKKLMKHYLGISIVKKLNK